MKGNLQQQPQVKILPVLSVNERLRSREADIDEVVRTVKGVLPQHVDGNIDVTITLLEKNLITADTALMKEALAQSCDECNGRNVWLRHVLTDYQPRQF